MSRHQPFVRASVDVVNDRVVLSLSRPRARHLATVINRTRPREAWLQAAAISMLTAADRVGVPSEELYRRVDWLDASALVSQSLLQPGWSLTVVVQEIADGVLRLSDGCSLTIVIPAPDDPALLEVRFAAGEGAAELLGQTVPRRGSAGGSAMRHDQGWFATTAERYTGEAARNPPSSPRPVMAVPIRSGAGLPLGAIVVQRRSGQPSFDPTDLTMVEDFARQTSLALELAESRARPDGGQQRGEHEHVTERLHDDLLQRLFSIGMTVQSAESDLRGGEDTLSVRRAEAHLARAVEELNVTIREARGSLHSRSPRPIPAGPSATRSPHDSPETTPAAPATDPSVEQRAAVAASLLHAAAVQAADVAQVAVVTAADRATEAASTARAQRSAAVDRAAEAVAARVSKAAAAVQSEADLAALTVAQAAFDAAFLIASTVTPGSERDAALTATLVATAVSAIAIKTAAVTAAARAEVAHDAAVAATAAAVAAADAETIVDLEVACAAEAVQAVARSTARMVAERAEVEATAFTAALH